MSRSVVLRDRRRRHRLFIRPAAVIGLLVAGFLTTSPAAAASLSWSPANPVDPYRGISGLSCASTQLCVAVDEAGHIAASTRPADGTGWTVASLDLAGLSGVSCPSTQLCVAVGTNRVSGGGKTVVTSTVPTSGTSGWREAVIEGGNLVSGLVAVSCPSVSFCAAVGGGDVYTSTNPTGGPSGWSEPQTIAQHGLTAISCASASLCVAVDHEGDILSSTNPTGGASSWKTVNLEAADLSAISCPSAQLCVAAGSHRLIGGGRIVVSSTNPASGSAESWSFAYLGGGELSPGLTAISCASDSLCVTVGLRDVLTSTNPIGGPGAWSGPQMIAQHGLTALSCPLNWFCAATDEAGNAYTALPAGSGPPLIEAESVSNITPTDATLEAQINTKGLETTYTFYLSEEGPPCLTADPPCMVAEKEPVSLPSGRLLGSFVGQSVSADLNSAGVSLSPGVSYEYWVSATNAAGITEGQHQSFTTPPEAAADPLKPTSRSTDPMFSAALPSSEPHSTAHHRHNRHRRVRARPGRHRHDRASQRRHTLRSGLHRARSAR